MNARHLILLAALALLLTACGSKQPDPQELARVQAPYATSCQGYTYQQAGYPTCEWCAEDMALPSTTPPCVTPYRQPSYSCPPTYGPAPRRYSLF